MKYHVESGRMDRGAFVRFGLILSFGAALTAACGAPPAKRPIPIDTDGSMGNVEGAEKLPLTSENTPAITLKEINKLRPQTTDAWQGPGFRQVGVVDGSKSVTLQETGIWMLDHDQVGAPLEASLAFIDQTHPEKGAVYFKFANESEFPGGPQSYADAINQVMETLKVQDLKAYEFVAKIPNGGLLDTANGQFAKVVVREGQQVVMTQMLGVHPRIAVESGLVLDEAAFAELAATLSKPVRVMVNGVPREFVFDPEFLKNTAVVPGSTSAKMIPVDGALAEIVVGSGDNAVVKGWITVVKKVDPGVQNYAAELAIDLAKQSEGTPLPAPEPGVPKVYIDKSAMMTKLKGIIGRMGSTLTVLSFATMPLQLLGDIHQMKKRLQVPEDVADKVTMSIQAMDTFEPGKRAFHCSMERINTWQFTIPLRELPKDGQTPKEYWTQFNYPDGSTLVCGDGAGGGEMLGASFSTHMWSGQEQFVMHFSIPQGQRIEVRGVTDKSYGFSMDAQNNQPWIIDYKEARYLVTLPDGYQYFVDVHPGEALIISNGISSIS